MATREGGLRPLETGGDKGGLTTALPGTRQARQVGRESPRVTRLFGQKAREEPVHVLRRRSQSLDVAQGQPGDRWSERQAQGHLDRGCSHTEQLSFYTYVGESLRNVFGGFEKMGSVTHLRQSWAGSRAP